LPAQAACRTQGKEVTGVDWDTGRTMFGKITAGNGPTRWSRSSPDGDMIFTPVTGPVRIPLSRLDPKPIEPAPAWPGS